MPVKLRRIFHMLVIPSVPAILLVVNQMLASQFSDARTLADEAERAHLLRGQLNTILSTHQDIEIGQRSYVLTGEPVFLEPYARAEARLPGELAALDTLAAGRPDVQAAVGEMRALSERKRAFAAETINLTRQGRRLDAERLIASRRGKAVMDALRARIGRSDAAVAAELEATRRDRAIARVQTERVAYALQALLVVMLIVAAWLLMRSLRAERLAARRFRDSSARLEAVFDAATDGLVIHDGEGTVESANPAMARMHGYDPDELAGRHLDIFFKKPFPREQLRAWLRKIANSPEGSTERTREFIGCRKDGSAYPADVVVSPVILNDRSLFLAAVRDATGRKRVEQMKNDFVATVSHELRTPLTSIAGSLGLLGGGAAGVLPDKAMRLVKIAHNNSERLVRLINDILDIEKIESGKMTFNLKWLRLGPVLEQAVHANRGFADRHHVELDLAPVSEDAAVIADEDRLIQVVTNLLSNAVKFSPEGEKVRIRVEIVDERCRITVADKGPGIPEAFHGRIFGKFAQADASDARSKSGTGLGLSIAREIVTRLGGAIGFDSRPGEGAVFHVDLPAAGAREAAPSGAPLRSATSLPRVLHVDADPDMLRVIAGAFEGKAEIRSTPSVREGYVALQRDRFDAAILEVSAADGSGLDLLPLLRETDPPTPTALFTIHDVSPSYAARVDTVLTKSGANVDKLVATVMGLVEREGEG
jgi:PAS domain S-box-containing protein